jgi:hypothetical protein
MSTKPETLFYKQIFRELKQVFWSRIENRHGGGIPDLYGVYNGFSFWLECKTIIKQNRINISPLQISWNYKNFSQNPNNFYIVQAPRRKVIKLYDGDKGERTPRKWF